MKKLNVTFEVNNDLEEDKLRTHLESIGGKYIKTLPNTEHLKDKANYKALSKEVTKAKDNLYTYINNNRC